MASGTIRSFSQQLADTSELSSAVTLTLGTATQTAYVKRVGRTCFMNVSVGASTGNPFSSATGTDLIGNVPAGFRPTSNLTAIVAIRDNGAWASANYYPATLTINASTGDINIYTNKTTLNGYKYIFGTITWTMA